jgi:hypothetical protein
MDTINLQTGKPINIYLPNIYRYMNKEYVDMFFKEGKLRLSSFKKFHEYPDEIRGDKNEGSGGITGIGNSGFQFNVMTNVGKDSYILCGSLIDSEEIKKEFECDSCFRIVKPLEFSVAISNALTGYSRSFQGFCNYQSTRILKKAIEGMDIKDFTGPEGTLIDGGPKGNQRINQIIGNGIDLMFLKEEKYQSQSEYRFIWSINTNFYAVLEYIDIECKEAIQFCERIEK